MFELKEKTIQSLYRYALALSKNHDLSYDLVHDAIIQLKGRIILKKEAYLKTCIRNKFYDLNKRTKKINKTQDSQRFMAVFIKYFCISIYLTENLG